MSFVHAFFFGIHVYSLANVSVLFDINV